MAGYNNWTALAYFLLISSIFAVSTVYGSISWQEPEITVKKGENVDITCSIKNVDTFDVVMVEKRGEDMEYTLTERDQVKDPFLESGRYTVDYNLDKTTNTATIKVHITDIIGADSGELGCKKKGTDHVKYVKVNVKEPVDEVYFMQWKKKQENEERVGDQVIHLRQGRKGGISCVALVKGQSADPEMTILVDDEDKTESFDLKPAEIVTQGSGALGEKVNQVKLSMSMTDPPTSWHDKEIACEAKLPDYPAEVARARIEVKSKPKTGQSTDGGGGGAATLLPSVILLFVTVVLTLSRLS